MNGFSPRAADPRGRVRQQQRSVQARACMTWQHAERHAAEPARPEKPMEPPRGMGGCAHLHKQGQRAQREHRSAARCVASEQGRAAAVARQAGQRKCSVREKAIALLTHTSEVGHVQIAYLLQYNFFRSLTLTQSHTTLLCTRPSTPTLEPTIGPLLHCG